MKENKLTITINKPASYVFDFTLNPKNTPQWIDGIVEEETNEVPVKLGTIYRNKDRSGSWSIYKITEFEKDATFTLSHADENYHVRYTFESMSDHTCSFEYYEWVNEGKLDDAFSYTVLEKLKSLIEL